MTREAVVDSEPYTDEFGTHFTAYCPVYDGKELAGIICMDSTAYKCIKKSLA